MKLFLIFLFSLPLFSFQNSTVYTCKSLYRADVELSKEDQDKSLFDMYINKDGQYIRTSNSVVYKFSKQTPKYKLYRSAVKINGNTFQFKFQLLDDNRLYKSVQASGYNDLIIDYVVCKEK